MERGLSSQEPGERFFSWQKLVLFLWKGTALAVMRAQ